jgi:hypothetical protein
MTATHNGSSLGNRQWGYQDNAGDITVNFPIAFTSECYAVVGNDMATESTGSIKVMSFGNVTKTSFDLHAIRVSQTASNTWCRWLAVGD